METDKYLQFLDFNAEYSPVPEEEWLCPWCLNKLSNFFDSCSCSETTKE